MIELELILPSLCNFTYIFVFLFFYLSLFFVYSYLCLLLPVSILILIILAIKILLTSKLIENKIIMINSEKLDSHKAKELSLMTHFLAKNPTLIVTGIRADPNFEKAKKRIKHLNHLTVDVK